MHSPITTPTFASNGLGIQADGLYAPQPTNWQVSMPQEFVQPAYTNPSLSDDDNATMWWPNQSQQNSHNPNQHQQMPQSNTNTAPMPQAPQGYSRNHHNTKSLALQLQNELVYNANELAMSPSSHAGMMMNMPPSPTHAGQPPYIVPANLRHQRSNQYFSHEAPPPIPAHHAANGTISSPQKLSMPNSAGFLSSPMRKSRSRQQAEYDHSPCSSPVNTSRHLPQHMQSTPSLHNAYSTPNFSAPLGNMNGVSLNVTKSRSVARKQSEPAMGSHHRHAHSHSHSHSHAERPAKPSSSRGRGHQRSKSGGSAAAAGGIEFCNFTPQDSNKILSGVAPSGSSKTKARREKEAMERRRRLSQAAVRAITKAGGDVDDLKDVLELDVDVDVDVEGNISPEDFNGAVL
jgi:hypothetical protein